MFNIGAWIQLQISQILQYQFHCCNLPNLVCGLKISMTSCKTSVTPSQIICEGVTIVLHNSFAPSHQFDFLEISKMLPAFHYSESPWLVANLRKILNTTSVFFSSWTQINMCRKKYFYKKYFNKSISSQNTI